eukprot:TRINITY_DN39113_c0_g1_i2.p1 TRINITY_DN39113_c0_g1~~TRINITY_DN39113_c0_g1_i2.p1  ORF type:complete len:1151 (+),score=289.17 TRINITY_DN39113_c0_g1_i2:223-3675(+)
MHRQSMPSTLHVAPPTKPKPKRASASWVKSGAAESDSSSKARPKRASASWAKSRAADGEPTTAEPPKRASTSSMKSRQGQVEATKMAKSKRSAEVDPAKKPQPKPKRASTSGVKPAATKKDKRTQGKASEDEKKEKGDDSDSSIEWDEDGNAKRIKRKSRKKTTLDVTAAASADVAMKRNIYSISRMKFQEEWEKEQKLLAEQRAEAATSPDSSGGQLGEPRSTASPRSAATESERPSAEPALGDGNAAPADVGASPAVSPEPEKGAAAGGMLKAAFKAVVAGARRTTHARGIADALLGSVTLQQFNARLSQLLNETVLANEPLGTKDWPRFRKAIAVLQTEVEDVIVSKQLEQFPNDPIVKLQGDISVLVKLLDRFQAQRADIAAAVAGIEDIRRSQKESGRLDPTAMKQASLGLNLLLPALDAVTKDFQEALLKASGGPAECDQEGLDLLADINADLLQDIKTEVFRCRFNTTEVLKRFQPIVGFDDAELKSLSQALHREVLLECLNSKVSTEGKADVLLARAAKEVELLSSQGYSMQSLEMTENLNRRSVRVRRGTGRLARTSQAGIRYSFVISDVQPSLSREVSRKSKGSLCSSGTLGLEMTPEFEVMTKRSSGFRGSRLSSVRRGSSIKRPSVDEAVEEAIPESEQEAVSDLESFEASSVDGEVWEESASPRASSFERTTGELEGSSATASLAEDKELGDGACHEAATDGNPAGRSIDRAVPSGLGMSADEASEAKGNLLQSAAESQSRPCSKSKEDGCGEDVVAQGLRVIGEAAADGVQVDSQQSLKMRDEKSRTGKSKPLAALVELLGKQDQLHFVDKEMSREDFLESELIKTQRFSFGQTSSYRRRRLEPLRGIDTVKKPLSTGGAGPAKKVPSNGLCRRIKRHDVRSLISSMDDSDGEDGEDSAAKAAKDDRRDEDDELSGAEKAPSQVNPAEATDTDGSRRGGDTALVAICSTDTTAVASLLRPEDSLVVGRADALYLGLPRSPSPVLIESDFVNYSCLAVERADEVLPKKWDSQWASRQRVSCRAPGWLQLTRPQLPPSLNPVRVMPLSEPASRSETPAPDCLEEMPAGFSSASVVAAAESKSPSPSWLFLVAEASLTPISGRLQSLWPKRSKQKNASSCASRSLGVSKTFACRRSPAG